MSETIVITARKTTADLPVSSAMYMRNDIIRCQLAQDDGHSFRLVKDRWDFVNPVADPEHYFVFVTDCPDGLCAAMNHAMADAQYVEDEKVSRSDKVVARIKDWTFGRSALSAMHEDEIKQKSYTQIPASDVFTMINPLIDRKRVEVVNDPRLDTKGESLTTERLFR